MTQVRNNLQEQAQNDSQLALAILFRTGKP
jgi:hypothetical protein